MQRNGGSLVYEASSVTYMENCKEIHDIRSVMLNKHKKTNYTGAGSSLHHHPCNDEQLPTMYVDAILPFCDVHPM